MKISKKPNYANKTIIALSMTIGILIGTTLGITIAPRHDYSPCMDVAEQDRYIVSQDGIMTDLAIQTINGRNFSYNKSLSKCLELAR